MKKRRINEKSGSFDSNGWGGLCLRGGGGALGRTWRGLRVGKLDPVAGCDDNEEGRERLDLQRRPDPLQGSQLLARDNPTKIKRPSRAFALADLAKIENLVAKNLQEYQTSCIDNI